MTDTIPTLDEYHRWLSFEAVNALRMTRIVGSVVAVGVCVTPAAWALAPTVGGALGGLTGLSGAAATSHGLAILGGGSIAAGGLGMAGGTYVVAAAGGALGGALGGAITTAYVRSDSSFRIERLRSGSGTPVVVANGFLTEGKSGWAQWQTLIDAKYPDAPVYRVHWGARELADLGAFVGVGASKQIAKGALAALGKKASKAIGSLPGLGAVLAASDLAANPWTVAKTRADMTGAVVADLIARTDERRFILVGHSLGGRVMIRAAQDLSTAPGPSRIESIHLLGAAVSRGEDWRTLQEAVSDRIWNYHSTNDKVLSVMYPTAQLGKKAVGGRGFSSAFEKIVDRDVTAKVSHHGAYFHEVQLRG